MNSLNKYEITKNENILPEGKVINNNKFWNEFFFRIGNGESLREVSKDLGIPFQSVRSAIMSDEKRRAAYEDTRCREPIFMLQRLKRYLRM